MKKYLVLNVGDGLLLFLGQVYKLIKDLWQFNVSNITRMFSKNYAFWQYYGSNFGKLIIQITYGSIFSCQLHKLFLKEYRKFN
ncbi:hypothetical protein BK702_02850 [Bacillus thuringiensis serovar cameroun]|nr:hypothetical protein BK702_02850 [Bacillus thuringiensis serovar cameroun]